MSFACSFCASVLHTGEARATVSLTAAELEQLALASPDANVAERLFTALGLIDQERERQARAERAR